ncbi:BN860_12882g1_1 [Zygosaccharomyces bailii CLIB 213]|uniref:BN860_12882g1_1 n=1 Tax=Zygosaccharomyces bailii (strain CLIB 213 / ATCC 58445 / CBS 680 / BCRC 21525 / NBRC 1098 / NCYC 1416 / NRRL Y-2227) TaxID=1333698 RepID=A0A8J2T7E2_ZYGB2|nr:BN860_12882g1_1 [Zygosaccharomyces bailii CLIB 213]
MTAETGVNVVCKKLRKQNSTNDASPHTGKFDPMRPIVLPTPPPVPTRNSAMSSRPNHVMLQVANRHANFLAHRLVPRVVPDFNNGLMRSSALRSTLGKTTKYMTVRSMKSARHDYVPPISADKDNVSAAPSSALSFSSPKKSISGLLKIAKYMDDRGNEEIEYRQNDAAIALLVLKECSTQISEMSGGWSHLTGIPLCDFVVAQRRCQTMLNSIETLKEMKIASRDSHIIEERKHRSTHKVPKLTKEKNVKFYGEEYKHLRSASVVPIINPQPSLPDKEKTPAQRGSSMSSERTLTYSPLSSDRSTSSPVPSLARNESNSNSNYSPYRPATTPSSQPRKAYLPFAAHSRKHIGKIGKTSKSGKNRNAHMRCLHCLSTETPEWRKGPGGPTTLCNACGLFYKKLIKKFGEEEATSIMKSRQIENPQDRKIPRFSNA